MNLLLLSAMLNWTAPMPQDTVQKLTHPHDNMPIYKDSGRSIRMPGPKYYFEITPRYRTQPSKGGNQPADSTKKRNWIS